MASRKFKFVSPGVFLKEIDNSQLPKVPGRTGPVIIGRTRKGPTMKPYKVGSFEEFEAVFGQTVPGNQAGDPWRNPGLLATAYAPYAAQAYLKSQTPVTMIRLGGILGDNASASETNAHPGWESTKPWGLFLAASGSTNGQDGKGDGFHSAASAPITASLAAVFYGTDADFTVGLYGTCIGGDQTRTANTSSLRFDSGPPPTSSFAVPHSAGKYILELKDGTNTFKQTVSFTPGDPEYIRDVLNTNPVRTTTRISNITTGTLSDKYWLGETFEEEYRRINTHIATASTNILAFTLPLQVSAASGSMGDFKSATHDAAPGQTGWVFHQNFAATGSYDARNLQKLFRIIAIQDGEHFPKNHIVEIQNIKIPETGAANPYSTFSVCVKMITPTGLVVVERFDRCNLNPNSQNFIAKQMGDQYFAWDTIEKRNKVYGTNPNLSQFIRVEVHRDISETGPDNNSAAPFGYFGPIVPKAFPRALTRAGSGATEVNTITFGEDKWIGNHALLNFPARSTMAGTINSASVSFNFPRGLYVEKVPETNLSTNPTLGARPYRMTSTKAEGTLLNESYVDYGRRAPIWATTNARQTSGIVSATDTEVGHSYIFSLDDTVITGTTTSNVADLSSFTPTEISFVTGSQVAGTAYTALSNGSARALARDVIDSFRMPLVGGCEGIDVREADPFNMHVVNADATTANNYAYASIDRAIELIRDPEAIEMNLAAMPGVTNENLTKKLVDTCEARADSLAIIDLPDVYIEPWHTACDNFQQRINSKTPTQVATALTARQINSSYGATYYPWVKVRDNSFNRDVWVPPSVIALGVMAYSEERTNAVWFAPAGFNRGGLNEGNAGLPVLAVTTQLLAKQRDILYEANINPIASFISEGLVVFGQKTLQTTQSALDRINVRRLLIFVKRRISTIASTLLFDQNVQATWNRFKSKVEPFLEGVKTELGLTDFRVILDKSTTTADLVDRNIMYAKIFLKPARSIEFIAVDFVITRTGAGFGEPE